MGHLLLIMRPANIMMVANIINPPVAALPWDPTLANYYIHKLVPFFKSLEVLAVEQGVERVVGAFGAIENAPNGGPQLALSTAPISMISDQRVFWELLIAAVYRANLCNTGKAGILGGHFFSSKK